MKDATDITIATGNPAAEVGPGNHLLKSEVLPEGDYVSDGLSVVILDRLFPNMIVGNKAEHPWPYLRREVSHNWYCDRRYPVMGFLNRDEVMLLYNLALQFSGKPGLEIGCWMGWSTCHLALAGLQLDVIDPAIAEPDNYESITHALAGAQTANNVRLFPGLSPEAVEQLAAVSHRKWSFFFIDANHGAPAPAQDARVCLKHAADDTLFVFHDMTSPDVEKGLDVLRGAGFQTMIYQTMQIIGIAWRGNARPVRHQPDPSYDWPLPDHLAKYPIAGETPEVTAYRLGRQLNLSEIELARTEAYLAELQSELDARTDQNGQLAAENARLAAENGQLAAANEVLVAENGQLAAARTHAAIESGQLAVALVRVKEESAAAEAEWGKILAQARNETESIAAPLNQEAEQLWHSRSWRLLRPLRNFVRRRRGLGKETEPGPQSGPEALRTVIAIRQSLSWELTACLRLWHRVLASIRPAWSTARRPMPTANVSWPTPTNTDRSGSTEISTSPWNSVVLPKPAEEVMAMLSLGEKRLLYYLGREYWRGDGAIVDAGCFVGGSTVAFAEGVAVRQHKAIGRPIHSYDLFRAERYMIDMYFRPEGLAIEEGDSIRPLFDANTSSISELLDVHEGDIRQIGWSGKPIELFFIDLAKSWALNDYLLERFFPHLIPKRSIVIQQDYVHERCPWLHVTMELLSEFFDFIAYVPGGSAVFRLRQKIPAEFTRRNFVSRLPSAEKLRLMDQAVERWSGAERAVVECAKAFLLAELEGPDSANAHLDLVEREFGTLPRAAAATDLVRSWIRLEWATPSPPQDRRV
jgi:predicted O-methyltransferase YrrM